MLKLSVTTKLENVTPNSKNNAKKCWTHLLSYCQSKNAKFNLIGV